MDNRIKESYQSISMADSTKEDIYNQIINSNCERSKTKQNRQNRTRKLILVASLMMIFLVPTVVFAAEKIIQYFQTSVSENGRQVDMKFEPTAGLDVDKVTGKQKYIKLATDFGADYTLNKSYAVKDSAFQGYEYKNGFAAGKNFWYELIHLDQNNDTVFSTYDNEKYKKLSVNGRNAVYCQISNVIGSQYEDTGVNYNQCLYVFIEDYGYILRVVGQQNLGEKGLMEIAEKMKIEETKDATMATPFVEYSDLNRASWESAFCNQVGGEVNTKNYSLDRENSLANGTVKVLDVKILDSAATLCKDYFDKNNVSFDELFDEEGNLKPYQRESIKYGDGISAPKELVTSTETISPKLVYVTAEYKNVDPIGNGTISLPKLQFVKKKGDAIYLNDYGYVRPTYITDAFTDASPCYFEETLGGKQFYFSKAVEGAAVLHFAYLVDEDLLNGMALCLNGWEGSNIAPIYIDISE